MLRGQQPVALFTLRSITVHVVRWNSFVCNLPYYIRVQVRGSKRFACHAGHQKSEESITHRQWRTQARDPSWFWNSGQISTEVQNKGIGGPTKGTHVFQNLFFLNLPYYYVVVASFLTAWTPKRWHKENLCQCMCRWQIKRSQCNSKGKIHYSNMMFP